MAGVTAAAGALAAVRAVAFLRLLHSFPPGSGRALSLLMAMRGGAAKRVRRDMPRLDQLALTVIGGLVLPLTMAAEDEEVRCPRPSGKLCFTNQLSSFTLMFSDSSDQRPMCCRSSMATGVEEVRRPKTLKCTMKI